MKGGGCRANFLGGLPLKQFQNMNHKGSKWFFQCCSTWSSSGWLAFQHCPKSVETQGRQLATSALDLHHAEVLLPAPACSCGAGRRQGLLQSTFPLCLLPAHTKASQIPSTVTWFSFYPFPGWDKLTTKSPLLASAGEGLEQSANTKLME